MLVNINFNADILKLFGYPPAYLADFRKMEKPKPAFKNGG